MMIFQHSSTFSSIFAVIFSLLISIECTQSDQGTCTIGYTWSSPIANTNVFGGTGNSASSVAACQSACVSTGNCLGIDWTAGNSVGQQCYLILTTTPGPRSNGTSPGVTHYDYYYNNCDSACTVGYTWSSPIASTNVFGGTGNSASSVAACQSACVSTGNCLGIDWTAGNSVGQQCYLILTTTPGPRSNGTSPGVTHYDYYYNNCNSACTVGNTWSTPIANTNVFGGTGNSASSVAACQSACVSTGNCLGIDWTAGNSVGQQCHLILTTTPGPRSNGTSPGVTHYDYYYNNCDSSCTVGNTWSPPIANTNVFGGTGNSASSVAACQSACVSTGNCLGIDWTAGNSVGQQCYLILTTTPGPRKNGTSPGVTHYDYNYNNCTSSVSTTISTTVLPTSSIIPGCVNGYTWSAAIANTNVLGGTGNGATSVPACQAACSSSANCIGIDWTAGNPVGQQCFIIYTTTAGPRNNGSAIGVTHYDYVYNICNGACTVGFTWSSPIANTNVFGGTGNSANSVAACQSACVSTGNCLGIDWTAGNSVGQQCYLIVTTTPGPRSNGTSPGVTHYDYYYNNCDSSCTVGNTWSPPIANTNVFGGTGNSANSVAACQSACVSTGNCLGIDWTAGNSVGQQCYLILTTTPGPRKNGTSPGVTHYDYYYNFCSSSSSASSTVTSPTSTNTAGCINGFTWSNAIPNTSVFGGTGNGAFSVSACQTACQSTASCVGIDWALGNSIGQQCFLILSTTSGPRINGTSFGVTHYDYYYNNCATLCIPSYVWSSAIANTNVVGGTGNGAATIADCQSACRMTSNCIGIDWAPSNSAGQQCFLTLTTTRGPRNNGTASGITHYDYYFNNCAPPLSSPMSPAVTSASTSASCVSWTAFANTNVLGGVPFSSATSVTACQTACVSNAACTGVDWNPNTTPVSCFLILSSTGVRNSGVATGITHYDINRSLC